MRTKAATKKLRASFIAGTLAAAIALTGTLAWTSFTQRAVNEAFTDKNPGGRLHVDFDGLNKDIYVENFTDELTGLPIFVRVRLSEYMETGVHAGRFRDGLDADGRPLADGRQVEVQTPHRTEAGVKAYINEPDTWPIHIPAADSVTGVKDDEKDPVHDTWAWDLGGKTVYMPTFNKNKDSLSSDVNGTYVGPNGKFDAEDAYDDYVTYTTEESKADESKKIIYSKEADAYYDLDTDNDNDEYFTNTGAADSPKGGANGDGGKLNVNYEAKRETHIAAETRDATVLTMDQWKKKGSPIGDYWVWDSDGWAYWAAPLMPSEATGTLLTRIRTIQDTDKCYYAINVEGQFVTKDSIGTANTAEDGQPSNASGFYIDGITGEAKALLDKVTKVMRGRDEKWYVDEGSNVYRQIDPVTGQTKALVCAGTDFIIGTDDDVNGVIQTAADVKLTVGSEENNYGRLFLSPDAAHAYYRGVGSDGRLGTDDDWRIWHSGSEDFPKGTLEASGAGKVTVAAVDGIVDGKIVAGGRATLKATVYKDAAGTNTGVAQDVTWELTGNTTANTTIDQDGKLTVSADEPVNTRLEVVATAKVDDNVHSEVFPVTVLAPDAVTVVVNSDAATLKAHKTDAATMTLTANVTKGITPVTSPAIVWEVAAPEGGDLHGTTIDRNTGVLSAPVGYVSADFKVIVTATYNYTESSVDKSASGTKEITITSADTPIVTVNGSDKVEAGSNTNTYTAALDVTGLSYTTQWAITSPTDVTGLSIGPSNGVLTVPGTMPANTTINIEATTTYEGSKTVKGSKEVTVAEPTGMNFTAKVEKLKKGASGTFTAQVMNGSNPYASQEMNWRLDGAPTSSGTQLTGTGNTRTLTIGSDEGAKTLTVVATSAVSGKATVSQVVAVGDWRDEIADITPGSETTVTIDDIEWYVLAKRNNGSEALILSKYVLEQRQFNTQYGDGYNHWWNCPLRDYLNGEWLNGKSTLKNAAVETAITVRTTTKGTATQTSQDKVFLLSEADAFGVEARGNIAYPDSSLYTAGSRLTIPEMKGILVGGSGFDDWWMRSPGLDKDFPNNFVVSVTTSDGKSAASSPKYERGVRPALWVTISD